MYTFYLSVQKKALVALKKQSSTNQTNQSGLKRSKCIQLTAGFFFFLLNRSGLAYNKAVIKVNINIII